MRSVIFSTSFMEVRRIDIYGSKPFVVVVRMYVELPFCHWPVRRLHLKCAETNNCKQKSVRYLVFGCWGFEIRNQRKKRIQTYVVNSFFGILFLDGHLGSPAPPCQAIRTTIWCRHKTLNSKVLRVSVLGQPKSFAKRIFLRQRHLRWSEGSSFIRRIFFRRKKLCVCVCVCEMYVKRLKCM